MRDKIKYLLILFLLIFISKFSYSQKKQHELQYAIDSVDAWLKEISVCQNQEERFKLNYYVISYMDMLLHDDASFKMQFDSVQFMRVIDSKDGNLRVYTWNIFLDNGEFKYFGYIQHKDKKRINVFMLNDLSADTIGINRSFTSHIEWYGAMYYEIVEKEWNKHTQYILIGWDGADNLINRKVLEPLSFNRRGLPVFGDKVFVVGKEKKGRMIFEYAEMATMILRYNEKQDIIVIDHLVPSNSRFTGHYQYYGPDLSFDAFEFNMGRWYFISAIDFNKAINYEKKKSKGKKSFSKDF